MRFDAGRYIVRATGCLTCDCRLRRYGKYELKMDADGQKMEGSAEGNPSNWRKAERIEALGKVQPAHEHDH